MIELKTLTVSEYMNLEDKNDYDFAMKYAFKFTSPVDEYNIGDMMELPFGLIKDMQYDLEQNALTFSKLINYVLEVTGLKSIGGEPLDKMCRFINYLKSNVESIIEAESIALAYEPTEKELAAGMDRFNGLGVYLQIRKLTGGDITKYNAVRKTKYSVCFTELYASKQLYEYDKSLSELNRPRTSS